MLWRELYGWLMRPLFHERADRFRELLDERGIGMHDSFPIEWMKEVFTDKEVKEFLEWRDKRCR
jgi:hypothetical protein